MSSIMTATQLYDYVHTGEFAAVIATSDTARIEVAAVHADQDGDCVDVYFETREEDTPARCSVRFVFEDRKRILVSAVNHAVRTYTLREETAAEFLQRFIRADTTHRIFSAATE